MDLTKKTTILFPPDLYEHLQRLADERGSSVGLLVREACEKEYGHHPAERRVEAARRLAGMSLPVGTVAEMKRESVPLAKEPLP